VRRGPPDAVRGLRGAVAFLTRLPVHPPEWVRTLVPGASTTDPGDRAMEDWERFRGRPYTITLVGWLVGAIVAIPMALGIQLGLPPEIVAVATLATLFAVTGIHHLDGVADLGDALVVHGDADRRRGVLKDTTTGVGALLAVAFVLLSLALTVTTLARTPVFLAVGVVIAAEVGAKTGMATMACLGRAAHEGLGSQMTAAADPSKLVAPALLASPALLVTGPSPAAAMALLGALVGATLPWWWARRHLEGLTGDVFGAANEIGRLLGLLTGVIAWTLW